MPPPRPSESWFFFALLAVVAALTWFILAPYAGALVLAGTLAFLFGPLYRKLAGFLRSESVSALIVVLLVVVIIFLPLILFGVQIIGESTALYNSLTANGGFNAGTAVTQYLQAHFPKLQISGTALNPNDLARQGLAWLIGNLGSFFSGVAQLFFTALISLIGLFYFLKDGGALKQWLLDHAPLAKEYGGQVGREVEAVLGSVIAGTLAVAVVQGIVVGAGFFLFGVPNAVFWGALTVVVTLVPIVGTWLIALPGAAYLFAIGNVAQAVGLLIWSVVLINLVYNLIMPQFVRRKVDIHPYLILLAVLGGLGLFGPIGFLIGPLVVALLFALLRIYPNLSSRACLPAKVSTTAGPRDPGSLNVKLQMSNAKSNPNG